MKKAACLGLLLVQAALFLPVFSACRAPEMPPEAETLREQALPVQTEAEEREEESPKTKENGLLACLYADAAIESAFARNAVPDVRCAQAQVILAPHYANALYLACNALSGVRREIGLVVLIGPNHPGKGEDIQVSGADWYWDKGRVTGDAQAAGYLAMACDAALTDLQIAEDWSVQTLIPYVSRYFPDAHVVTVLLRRGTDRMQLEHLAQAVQELSREQEVLLLASADFSHYLDPASAQKNDARTLELIEAEDIAAILTLDNGFVDSPETLVTAMLCSGLSGQKLSKLDGLFERFRENGEEKAGSYYAFASVD